MLHPLNWLRSRRSLNSSRFKNRIGRPCAGSGDVEQLESRRLLSGGPIQVTANGSQGTSSILGLQSQDAGYVAMDAAGDFVVVWSRNNQAGTLTTDFAQRYNSEGTPLGSAFQVGTTTRANVYEQEIRPAVAMDSAGNFVVTWNPDNYHILCAAI